MRHRIRMAGAANDTARRATGVSRHAAEDRPLPAAAVTHVSGRFRRRAFQDIALAPPPLNHQLPVTPSYQRHSLSTYDRYNFRRVSARFRGQCRSLRPQSPQITTYPSTTSVHRGRWSQCCIWPRLRAGPRAREGIFVASSVAEMCEGAMSQGFQLRVSLRHCHSGDLEPGALAGLFSSLKAD